MAKTGGNAKRIALIDELRGLSILLMVAYHAAYDLQSFFGTPVAALGWPVMRVLQPLFAGVFILISGISCRFSRSNLRRGAITLAFGMGMTLATLILAIDDPIYFGILHLLGSCMVLYVLLRKPMEGLPPLPGAALMLVLFALTYRIPAGEAGFPPFWRLPLPDALTITNWGLPLGFVRPDFQSPDYYPLLPWGFLFFGGAYLGLPLRQGRAPAWVYSPRRGLLAAVGQHTLLIYLLHQPVLYGLFWLYFRLLK